MLDPRRLLTFREVARHGSFSRAAEALALSQPAVSQQVGALERELGTALLVRGRAGATPTPAGELLLTHADALAAQLDRADTQMGELVAGERRTLRLGAFPSALATIVPAAVEAACRQNPGLEVTIEEGTIDELARGVRTGALHAAACFQDASAARREHEGLRRVDLAEEPMVALLSADHRLAERDEIDIRELADDPWMAPSTDGILVTACRAAGFEPRIVILTRDPLASAAIAAAGLAVSLTPRLIGRIPLPGVAMPALRDAPRRSLYAVLPPAGAHPLSSALVEELAAALP
jgi:DNA-binding transcriptional LysR family regulator